MGYRGSSGQRHSGTADTLTPLSETHLAEGIPTAEEPTAQNTNKTQLSPRMSQLIAETARALQISPRELATIISFETGGTMDPLQSGPTTKWGTHRGLIQFGEPQAQQYGVDFTDANTALESQLGANGAIVKYALQNGYIPGTHNEANLYATINAGDPNKLGAKDEAAGGTPGTVLDKYNTQMEPHRAKFSSTEWDTGAEATRTADAGIPDEKTPQQKRVEGWKYFADAMSSNQPQVKMDPITNAVAQNVQSIDLVDYAIPEF